MRFSAKFLLFFILSLFITVVVNTAALFYFANEHFAEYTQTIRANTQETQDIDLEALAKFLEYKDLDDSTIEEYRIILQDLGALSNSFETLAKAPPVDTTPSRDTVEALQRIGIPSTSIERYIAYNAVSTFFSNLFNVGALDGASPEGVFVRNILSSLLFVNLFLFAVLGSLGYFAVRVSFRPVVRVTEGVRALIDRREYTPVEYAGRDEFGELVTAINRLNQHLGLQTSIRSTFLSDLSHEIKTPITALKCFLEGVQDGVISLDAENITFITAEIDRLIRVADSVMDFERTQNEDAQSLNIEAVDFIEIARNIGDEYLPMLTKNDQRVEILPYRFSTVMMDPDRCRQIIHNLISNFIRYAGTGTILTISLSRKKNAFEITFSDNGNGAPKGSSEFLVEKFYQVNTGRTNHDDRGMGIGLSVVEKIVRLHRGTLSIETDIGKGFQLSITLPR